MTGGFEMKRVLCVLLAVLTMLSTAVGAFASEEDPAAEVYDIEAEAEAAAEEPAAATAEMPAEEAVQPAADGETEWGYGAGESGSCTGTPIADSDTLLAGYLNEQLGDELFSIGGGPVTDGGTAAGECLEGDNLALYNQVRAAVQDIAAGKTASAVVTLTIPSVAEKSSYTIEDLGLSGTVSLNDALVALYAKLDYDLGLVMAAILSDLPYEMYWYGNRYAWTQPGYYYHTKGNQLTSLEFAESTITLSLSVQTAYAGSGSYTVKTDAAATVTAVNTAKSVVSAAAGKTNYEKLDYYREWICGAVSYDTAAAAGNASDLNPWNVIYVFDGNSSTNVVCEGYARAFQYLCDLTEWDGDVYCLYVSGYMGSGAHGWNVVHMPNGSNYLVDLTNCDTGMIGYPRRLFMVGGAGSASGGYTFCGSKYVYDSTTSGGRTSMWDVYTEDMLMLAGSSYDPEKDDHVHTYGDSTVSKAPTPFETGEKTSVCTTCGDKKTETVSKLTRSGTGWLQSEYTGAYYYFENGAAVKSRWVSTGGSWYYVGADGAMYCEKWLKSGGYWYYLKSDGVMAANELYEVDGVTYGFKSGGAMATGWLQLGNDWYYFASSGAMKTGWLKYNSRWYYLNPRTGIMATGLFTVGDAAYYCDANGIMKTGWVQIGSSWYYFASGGEMYHEQWLKSGGYWYYLKEDGTMAASETLSIDGTAYRFAANGKWVG